MLSRALSPLPIALEYMAPFTHPTGRLLAMKGQKADAEIAQSKRAMKMLKVNFVKKHLFFVETENETCVVELMPVKETPGMYPRSVGTAKQKPL